MPFHVFSQAKSDDESSLRYFPRFGQVANHVQVFVVFDKAVVYQGRDCMRCAVGGKDGYEIAGVPY